MTRFYFDQQTALFCQWRDTNSSHSDLNDDSLQGILDLGEYYSRNISLRYTA